MAVEGGGGVQGVCVCVCVGVSVQGVCLGEYVSRVCVCPVGCTPPPTVDRILDTRLWEHYLTAITVADGNNNDLIEVLSCRTNLVQQWVKKKSNVHISFACIYQNTVTNILTTHGFKSFKLFQKLLSLDNMNFITVRNEVAKVMFLHLSVSHSVHGGVCLSACWDTTPLGAGIPPEQARPWTRPPRTRHPSGSRHRPGAETATAADGTHPTGMHSC